MILTLLDEKRKLVKASNSQCGSSSRIRYLIEDGSNDERMFNIESTTGTICLEKKLDFEKNRSHQLIIAAIDQNGSSGTCLVSIQVQDVNDNIPVFNPTSYNITVRERYRPSEPLVVVSATDKDEGIFGKIQFYIDTGNSSLFYVNGNSGELFLKERVLKGVHEITIKAKDGGGSVSDESARVFVYVIDSYTIVPLFNQSKYIIRTPEDILPGISIGSVMATGPGAVRYSIYSGDIDNQFMIHPETGRITVVRYLDADKRDRVVLNVQIQFYIDTGNSSLFHVNGNSGELFLKERVLKGVHEITIKAKDGGGSVSDESAHVFVYVIDSYTIVPLFNQSKYIIRTPEDILPGISIGSVMATGPGAVRYSIYSGDIDNQFMIHPETGRITVVRYLDADKRDRVVLNVQAELLNGGTNQTQVIILIEDHNDNSPKFPIDTLEITVNENQSIHEPFYIVHATDKDKKKCSNRNRAANKFQNGAIVYSLISSHPPCPVAVRPTTGQLH
ncbi:cadherin domain protein [Dictyocaulus viviparus]|uniref:Cadherin domain protein n=1 Tax=Dictyocaulus viviparus TaxID=29172 RepID=A0A0D8XU49_DICVI|nr:cadherin domain protein [Dictyocaulus viviparus]